MCIFFNLPFCFPWAPGRPLVSQNSRLNVHKIPRLLVMTLFVAAAFLLTRIVSVEGDNHGTNWCLFGSQTAEPGTVETLSPFLWRLFCCALGHVAPWDKPLQIPSDAGTRWAGDLVPRVSLPGAELMLPFPVHSCCSPGDGPRGGIRRDVQHYPL